MPHSSNDMDTTNLAELDAYFLHDFFSEEESKKKTATRVFNRKKENIYKDKTFTFKYPLVRRTKKIIKNGQEEKHYIYTIYDEKNPIGKGGNGNVYPVLGKLIHENGRMVYIDYKLQNKQKIIKVQALKSEAEAYKHKEEFNVLQRLHQEGAINAKPKKLTFEKRNGIKIKSYQVSNRYLGKDLTCVLKEIKEGSRSLTVDQKFKLSINLLLALRKLHETGYVHKDIKEANIIVDPDTLEVNICDFGSTEKAVRSKQYAEEVYSAGLVIEEIFNAGNFNINEFQKNGYTRTDFEKIQRLLQKTKTDKSHERIQLDQLLVNFIAIKEKKKLSAIHSNYQSFLKNKKLSKNAKSSLPFYKRYPIKTSVLVVMGILVIAGITLAAVAASGGLALPFIGALGLATAAVTLKSIGIAIGIGLGVVAAASLVGIGLVGGLAKFFFKNDVQRCNEKYILSHVAPYREPSKSIPSSTVSLSAAMPKQLEPLIENKPKKKISPRETRFFSFFTIPQLVNFQKTIDQTQAYQRNKYS